MSEFKLGDILVSTKKQSSSSRGTPIDIPEGFIGENVSPTNPKVVWFSHIPPGGGSYPSKNFRLASEEEKAQYIKGKKVVEPTCPFEEGDIIMVEADMVQSTEGHTLMKGVMAQIDGIVKTKDPDKSIMYFSDTLFGKAHSIEGYFKVNSGFRKLTEEEIELNNQ